MKVWLLGMSLKYTVPSNVIYVGKVLTNFAVGTVGVVAARGHGGGWVSIADDGVGVRGWPRRGGERRGGRGRGRRRRCHPVVHPSSGRLRGKVTEQAGGRRDLGRWGTAKSGLRLDNVVRQQHGPAPAATRTPSIHQIMFQVHRAPKTPCKPRARTRHRGPGHAHRPPPRLVISATETGHL